MPPEARSREQNVEGGEKVTARIDCHPREGRDRRTKCGEDSRIASDRP